MGEKLGQCEKLSDEKIVFGPEQKSQVSEADFVTYTTRS